MAAEAADLRDLRCLNSFEPVHASAFDACMSVCECEDSALGSEMSKNRDIENCCGKTR